MAQRFAIQAFCGITGKVFSIIKFFLTDRSLKVVINGQSSRALTVNKGIPQWSVLRLTLFLNYINDLSKNILKSFVNFYAEDMTIYKCISKTLDDHRLEADHSSDLISQCTFHYC